MTQIHYIFRILFCLLTVLVWNACAKDESKAAATASQLRGNWYSIQVSQFGHAQTESYLFDFGQDTLGSYILVDTLSSNYIIDTVGFVWSIHPGSQLLNIKDARYNSTTSYTLTFTDSTVVVDEFALLYGSNERFVLKKQ